MNTQSGAWQWGKVLIITIIVGVWIAFVGLAGQAAITLAEEQPQAPQTRPTPGVGEQPDRILPKVQSKSTGPYKFLEKDAKRPVSYSPCRPVQVVVNLQGAPAGSLEVVTAAAKEISKASGIQLVIEGQTKEKYRSDRDYFQPDRYGDRWAPVLVSWAGIGKEPRFGGDTIGTGGSTSYKGGTGTRVYVTGAVTLNKVFFADQSAWSQYGILLHEFGHLLGLGHVEDRSQIMNEYGRDTQSLGTGDLAGLAKLGAGPCNSGV